MSNKTKKKELCLHYAQGNCTRGDNCRFTHEGVSGGGAAKRKRAGEQFRSREKQLKESEGRGEEVIQESNACVCRGHTEPCVERKVDKPGAKNHGRKYFQCSRKGAGSCGHFSWGDA